MFEGPHRLELDDEGVRFPPKLVPLELPRAVFLCLSMVFEPQYLTKS